ncbi:MBL fold metallo-hydrolase [Jiangella asiatica]|uniref:MBL fold metallo-hydrolase n=1 Tax=Jiangella asiatica TaxID=2530372 RepID=A0A4R5D8H6_9ACTN|nr:MBL fold metallo-hydrolase [Jiangella asiatica]TDE09862.1 MBL fold metallo-hydrolase [Jiangella asiatica]
MEVAPGLHRIETPFGPRVNAVYLFAGSRGSLLVDTATDETARSHVIPYLQHAGVGPDRLRYVLTTHSDYDHMAGNAALREYAPAAAFVCHELDRPMIEDIELMITGRYGEFSADHGHDETDDTKAAIRAATGTTPVDVGLQGGEVVDLGDGWRVTVLHTPGHSWGSISVHDPRSGTLVVGDAVLGNAVVTAEGEPAFPPTYRYVDTYVSTIRAMRTLAPQTLLTSHYAIQRGPAVAEFLAESQAFVDRTEQTLRAELRGAGGAVTVRELTEKLSPELGGWPQEAAAALFFPLSGHLERLAAYGLIELVPDPGRPVKVRWRD